jgi:hypothetical protein
LLTLSKPITIAFSSAQAKLLKTSGDGTDFVIAFVRSKSDGKTAAPAAIRAVGDKGLLWFAYPKKSSRLQSDPSRDNGWQPLYAAEFDSVAQISIDETRTGFRFRSKRLVGKRSREDT